MSKKQVNIENFNQKLGSSSFIHISMPPADNSFSWDLLPMDVVIKSQDMVFDAQLITKLDYPIDFIPEILSQLSHDMNPKELCKHLMEKFKVSDKAKVTVYLYKKNINN